MNDSPLYFAQADDGARIAFTLREAAPDKPRVAFLHTLGMDHGLWSAVSERIAAHASLLALDMRGHGRSDKTAPYTIERLSHDLRDVLDHVGWSTAVVAGSSLGGCVALHFAARHADRVAALGLVDTTAWYGPDAVGAWNERARRAREEGLATMVEFQETRWFSDAFREARPAIVERCITTFLANDVPAFSTFSQALGQFDGRHLLPGIQAPTGIVVGEEDYATPVTMAQALQRGIRGATLMVIPAARHLTHVERPDAVASMLARLLATLPETSPS